MSEEGNAATRPAAKPPLPVGGMPTAIVPATFEEIQRIAGTIIAAGVAPRALIGGRDVNPIAAVSIVIMAGAELGLPPMSALRSFTVINGRPALYADGLINVIRRSGKVKNLQMGFVPGDGGEYADTAYGFCKATRNDTGESLEVRFTVADAKKARLWDDREKAERWRSGAKETVDNDAPWHRFPKRMLQWRAAGYCLRELFADVLGGITDEYEARDTMIDVTPERGDEVPSAPPSPGLDGEIIPFTVVNPLNLDTYLAELKDDLDVAQTQADLIEAWQHHAPEKLLTEGGLLRAEEIYNQAVRRVTGTTN